VKRIWEIPARYNILTASGSAVLLGSGTLAAIWRTEMSFGMSLSKWVVMLVFLLGLLSNTNAQTITSSAEDFETNDFSKFPWEHLGDASWDTTRQESHSGSYSAESGSIEDGESTTLRVTLDCVSGYIAFYRKVSSESDYDHLEFYIDSVEMDKWSGEEDWAEVSFYVDGGKKTFEWTYSKDSSASRGDDTAWIDDIVFPVNSSLALERPSAVSTFHCIGIYWSPQDGSRDNVCQVHYRSEGSTGWKEALPLWYDDRGVGGYPAGYRGSIVNLDPGTVYEIKLELLNTGTMEEFIAETWSEDFPIAKTVYLPAGTTNQTFEITESGSPYGYILYTASAGGAVIDVDHNQDYCVTVNASYIIIRGLNLKGAKEYGIRLYDCHDVVIEECDISDFSSIEDDGWGNRGAAIYSLSTKLERIIVQRNKMHHPYSDTNSWSEYLDKYGSYHPRGPKTIGYVNSAGNHVIRYNEIYSEDDHYFEDCISAGSNNFPNRDSDIYGNYVANCWDDGIEAEDDNCNVRIWGNFIEWTYVKIAIAPTNVGPVYIWRNVSGVARKNDIDPWNNMEHGGFLKTNAGGGKTYVFHNTILQPEPPVGVDDPLGCSVGLGWGGPMLNTMSRNNILHVLNPGYKSIKDRNYDPLGDYDYDLYNGYIIAKPGAEQNGINGVPIYDPDNGDGEFALDPSSPGFDAGVLIPNFNDDYRDAAPDIGAYEAGSPPMVFGVNAYQ